MRARAPIYNRNEYHDLSYTTSCAVLLTSVTALAPGPASAQTTPPPANSGTAQTQSRHHARMLPGQLVGWADRLPEGGAEDRAGAGDAMAASGHGDARERERARPGDQHRPGAAGDNGCGSALNHARAVREGPRRKRCAPTDGVQAALRQLVARATADSQQSGHPASWLAPSRLNLLDAAPEAA